MPSFSSAMGKLERAKVHLEALHAVIQPIKEADYARLVHEYDPNARENLWRFQWGFEDSIAKLNPIIGDILTNCLSALDRLIYNLFGGVVIRDKDIYWPVSKSLDAWSSTKGKFKGLSDDILALIENYQPACRLDNADLVYLVALHWLANIDKHRRFNVIGWQTTGLSYQGPIARVPEFFIDKPLYPGTVVVRIPGEEVDMQFTPHVKIAFDETWVRRQRVDEALVAIVDTTEEVLTTFATRFP